MEIQAYFNKAVDIGADLGLKVIGALLLWIVGRWIIRGVGRLVARAFERREFDTTVAQYMTSSLAIGLNILLAIAILGVFGVQTTSFAAVLAAAGLAIGMAWSGMLANFAAGVFMLVLRPIRVGDFVEAGEVVGTVREIGILATVLDTLDNVRTIVGNKRVFEGTIRNYSANPYRRVDLKAQLDHSVDPRPAIEMLRQKISAIPAVLSSPAPEIDVLEFTLAGPVLAVRPFCTNENYWDVYFATNAAIRDTFGRAGFPAPANRIAFNTLNGGTPTLSAVPGN